MGGITFSTAMEKPRIRHSLDLLGPRKIGLLAGLAATLVLVDVLALAGAVSVPVALFVTAAAAALGVLNWRERMEAVRAEVKAMVDGARDMLKEGHFQRANAALQQALAMDPGNDQVYLLLSAMHRATRDSNGALNALVKAVMENPSSATHHYNLALAYIEVGESRAGMEQLMAAIECDEYLLDAYYMLGFLFEAEQRQAKALRCYEEMIWMADHWPEKRPTKQFLNLDKARSRLAALQSSRGVAR